MKKDEAKQLAEQGLADLQQALSQGKSEALKRYLTVMGRFPRYSWNNCLLIAIQKPDATFVAGFRRWLELGRHVRKGETGITIFAPLAYRKRDEASAEDAEAEVRGFKAVHVFDVSQTEGEALPDLPGIHGEPGELLARLEQLVRSSGIACGLPSAERFAVLAHELAHEWLHDSEQRQGLPKTVRETEAEAVAFVVCNAFGLDCSTRSSDYIQLYQGDEKTLSNSLERIQRTATKIIGILQQRSKTEQEGERHVA
jgi:antirestriction protein ArdC